MEIEEWTKREKILAFFLIGVCLISLGSYLGYAYGASTRAVTANNIVLKEDLANLTKTSELPFTNITDVPGIGAYNYLIQVNPANSSEYQALLPNGTVKWTSLVATNAINNATILGDVWLSNGVYTLTTDVLGHSGFSIKGNRGAILKVADSTQINAINITNQQNVTISGITIDGNKDNHVQDGSTIDMVNGIYLKNSVGCVIENCLIKNTLYHGILTDTAANYNRIVGNDFKYCGSSGGYYDSSTGVCLYRNNFGNLVSGNHFDHSFAANIRAEETNGTSNTIISNNIINGTIETYGVGIQLVDINSTVVKGNTIDNCFDGFLINGKTGVVTYGNQIAENTICNAYYGIDIFSFCTSNSFKSNIFIGSTGYDFRIEDANVKYTWLQGNFPTTCTISDSGTGTIYGNSINRAREGTVKLLDTWAVSPTNLANANDGDPLTSTGTGTIASGGSAFIYLEMANNYTCHFTFDFNINVTSGGTYTIYLLYTTTSFSALNDGGGGFNVLASGTDATTINWQVDGYSTHNNQNVVLFITATDANVDFKMNEFGAYEEIRN